MSTLDHKIRQLHEALAKAINSDLSSVTPERGLTDQTYYCKLDFAQGKGDSELHNVKTLLVANIACLRDHLKAWCSKSGKPFHGDELIDTDQNVALVHDLWNIDKHAELNRPPRSGHQPEVHNLRQALRLSTGTAPGSSSVFTFDPSTGAMRTHMQGSGSVELVISGEVVNEHGAVLGDFAQICETASTAWEQLLKQAGVPVPARQL